MFVNIDDSSNDIENVKNINSKTGWKLLSWMAKEAVYADRNWF